MNSPMQFQTMRMRWTRLPSMRSAALTEEEVAQLGEWAVEEDYEDMLRKYALLDDYGKAAVGSILRAEFNRAQEQGTLNSSMSIAVSVRLRVKAD